MLIVKYNHGFSVDVGYIADKNRYYITTLKDENWNPYLEQHEASTMDEMLPKLQQAIDLIVASGSPRYDTEIVAGEYKLLLNAKNKIIARHFTK